MCRKSWKRIFRSPASRHKAGNNDRQGYFFQGRYLFEREHEVVCDARLTLGEGFQEPLVPRVKKRLAKLA